jgi:hypothetical protein
MVAHGSRRSARFALMPDAEQLTLPVDAGEIALLNADESSSIFSGCTGEGRARIRKLREQILELTAAGVGVKRIASALDVSPQAVRAVRASAWERGELDPMKERLGRQYLAAADLLRAEALERIEDIPPQVLLLASAQAADKGQLLTGGATARIERASQAPADLHALIDALPVVPELREENRTSCPVEAEGSAAHKGLALGAVVEVDAGAQVDERGARDAADPGATVGGDCQSAAPTRESAACASPCEPLGQEGAQ